MSLASANACCTSSLSNDTRTIPPFLSTLYEENEFESNIISPSFTSLTINAESGLFLAPLITVVTTFLSITSSPANLTKFLKGILQQN